MNPRSSLSWLHLTDLHQGLRAQSWLWPGVREKLLEDLERLHEQSGPWDLVLFTGDLTQRGSEKEFQALDETLEGLWKLFRRLGSSPVLLAVPGNHDLLRPDESEALRELDAWEGWPSVQERFWQQPNTSLRGMLAEAFHPFVEWQSRWYERHPLPASATLRQGILPGDFSASFLIQNIRLGVVGLNSAFLQLAEGDFRGRLDLDIRQFHGACAGDAMAWTRQNHLTFLLTHHPVDWLHPRSQAHFRAEIDPPGRFAAHFFGHMHSAGVAAERLLGFEQQCRIQGASLFGLETFGEQQTRIHGYSAGRLELTSPTAATLRIWPRLFMKSSAGFWHIIPDPNFRLEKESFTHTLRVNPPRTDERLSAADEAFAHARNIAERLSQARAKHKALVKTSGNPAELARVEQEVLQLQREQRAGRPLRPGDLLSGRYELLDRVGAGGFATVWKAFDDQEERLVAVKVLHRDVAEDASRRERFFKGMEAMAHLRHPNILPVFELRGEDGPYLYAVMEYVPDGDLRTAVQNRRLTHAQFFNVILDIGDALEEAHRHGLIHRDVKPANILLRKDGTALLSDFDLVRVTNSVGITRTGVMGTFLYAAPEVLESGKKADARSDVFSLGMTVLHGLHGEELPLEAFRSSRGFIERLECGEALKRVLLKAVEWERHERHASVSEFCGALEHTLNIPGPAKNEVTRKIPRKSHRPRLLSSQFLAPLGLGIIALGVLIALVEHSRQPQKVQVVLDTMPSNAKLNMDGVFIGFSPQTLADVSPGRRLRVLAEAPRYKSAFREIVVGKKRQQVEHIVLEPLSEPPSLHDEDEPEPARARAVMDETRETLPAELQTAMVRFVVKPHPEWAEISCDGTSTNMKAGKGSVLNLQMAVGTHECTFWNPNQRTLLTQRVEVKLGGPNIVVMEF